LKISADDKANIVNIVSLFDDANKDQGVAVSQHELVATGSARDAGSTCAPNHGTSPIW